MSDCYIAYLDLLDTLREKLQVLSELASKKAAAVRGDDLTALDDIMRKEQALSLTFRGLEQKKAVLSKELGFDAVPLSSLANHYPESLQLQARQTVLALQDQFRLYRAAAEVARNTLECNLHEIEKFLASQEAVPSAGPGYEPPPVEPPHAMKSDFRA